MFSRLSVSNLRIFVVLVGVLILAIGFSWGTSDNSSKTDNNTTSQNENVFNLPSPGVLTGGKNNGSIVFGLWSANLGTQIRVANTSQGSDYTLAQLPANIKDVHVLSNNKLLFIANTDSIDHGKEIVIYDTKTYQTEQIVQVEEGRGIDDIVLSPDKKFIAWWEVKFDSKTNVLKGGESKVFIQNLEEKMTKLVVDESQSVEMHYPLFFDWENRLYLDAFKPNQGRQYYLGISFVTYDSPTVLNPISQLTKGKFSSQPILSPLDNKVVYTGFDGKDGNGKTIFYNPLEKSLKEELRRPELDNPNQVILLDLDNLASDQEKIIAGSENNQQYRNLIFSSDGKYVVYAIFHISLLPSGKPNIVYSHKIGIYSLDNGETIYLDDNSPAPKIIIDYKDNQLIYGETEGSTSIGNLGETYSSTLRSFVVSNAQDKSKLNLAGTNRKMQFISYEPYQKSGKLNLFSQTTQPTIEKNRKSLELVELIVPDTKNVENRLNSQNNPIKPAANQTLNPDVSPTPSECSDCTTCCELVVQLCGTPCDWVDYSDPHYPNGRRCDAYENHVALGYKCYDSPLYLYPQKTSSVNIKPKVSHRIYYSNPQLKDQSWEITASPNGQLVTTSGEYIGR